MDDLQLRRNLYAEPNDISPDMRAALDADQSKQQFAKEIELLDQKIAAAMQVEVPDDLVNKLIFKQTLVSHQQQKRKTRVHLALAASVAFAIGLSVNFLQFSSAYDNLADHALAHIYHEDGVFSNNDQAVVSLTSLNQKMSTFGGNFKGLFGDLISAEFCRFDGIKSLHLVFKGENAPISIFVMPNDNDFKMSNSFSDDKFSGKTLMYRTSNVVVIGEKAESLNQWQQKIDENITWSI
jgi:hypothetical protein